MFLYYKHIHRLNSFGTLFVAAVLIMLSVYFKGIQEQMPIWLRLVLHTIWRVVEL